MIRHVRLWLARLHLRLLRAEISATIREAEAAGFEREFDHVKILHAYLCQLRDQRIALERRIAHLENKR